MTLKLTLKVKEFRSHLFFEGNHDVAEQNKKVHPSRTFAFELFAYLKSLHTYRQPDLSITMHAKRLITTTEQKYTTIQSVSQSTIFYSAREDW
jgi:hypothetical protein